MMKSTFRNKKILAIGLLLCSLSIYSAEEDLNNGEPSKEVEERIAKGIENFPKSLFAMAGSAVVYSIISKLVGPWLDYKINCPQVIVDSSDRESKIISEDMVFSSEKTLILKEITEIAKNNAKQKKNFRTLLLYGPPGTGKSMLAKELARELFKKHGMPWILITGSGFFQNYAGVKSVNDIFCNRVRKNKNKGMTIIIDEVDSLLSDRDKLNPDSESYRVINQVLTYLGERSSDRIIIMTSNYLTLDEAMERRIDDCIELPLPGAKERLDILKLYEKKYNLRGLTEEKINDIVNKTDGFSPHHLEGIIDKLKSKSNIDSDTDVEKNAEEVVQEYIKKKQLFKKQN